MKMNVKTIGMTAALAVMIPLSAYAATNTTATSTNSTSTSVEQKADSGMKRPGGFEGRGGLGFRYIDEDVLTLLGLTQDQLKEKLAAGSTLAEIAAAQGVSTADLKKALTTAFEKHQAEEATKFSSNLDTMITSKQQSPGGGAGKKMGFGFVKDLSSVATLLGLTEDELKNELASGKTLAAIAKEKGVETTKLTDAIVSSLTEKINQAVTDGKLTQEQADEKLAKVAETAEKIVNGEMGFGHRGGMGGPGGPRGEKAGGQTTTNTESTSTSA